MPLFTMVTDVTVLELLGKIGWKRDDWKSTWNRACFVNCIDWSNPGTNGKITSQKKRTEKEGIVKVANRFKKEYEASLFLYKITLDTTHKTPEKPLNDFTNQTQPYFTDSNRIRILTRKALLTNDN